MENATQFVPLVHIPLILQVHQVQQYLNVWIAWLIALLASHNQIALNAIVLMLYITTNVSFNVLQMLDYIWIVQRMHVWVVLLIVQFVWILLFVLTVIQHLLYSKMHVFVQTDFIIKMVFVQTVLLHVKIVHLLMLV